MKLPYYEWDAECYQQHAKTPEQATLAELEHYSIENHWHILDLGCGDGRITATLAEKASQGKIVGIDRSANMIAYARLYHRDISQLDFQVMEMKELNSHDQFDFVLSSWAFHHLPKLEKKEVLKRIFIALTPGGNLLITVPKHSVFNHLIDQFIKTSTWNSYFDKFQDERSFLAAQEYKDILVKLGYVNIIIEEKIAKSVFKNTNELMLSIQSWLPQFRYLRQVIGIPIQKQHEFLDAIANLRLKMNPIDQTNNFIVVETPYLSIRARKNN